MPANDQDFRDPRGFVDSTGWMEGDLRGRRVLCLAAGGGKHGPLFAAAGADVTVVDISPAMLELDREVATERKLKLRTVEASMDQLSALSAAEFDVVFHPVSTCYVPEVAPVYREVARITRVGGLYISQHKQPTSMQADIRPTARGGYEVTECYYVNGPLPPVEGSLHREEGTLEYLHRWEEIVGDMCRAGFVIEDFLEPMHARLDAVPGSFGHRSQYIAPYVRIKARRVERGRKGGTSTPPSSRLLMP